MEWILSLGLGPELVYAVMGALVTGVLAWIGRGFSLKRDLKRDIAVFRGSLKKEIREEFQLALREERIQRREELLKLAEKVSRLENGQKLASEIRERASGLGSLPNLLSKGLVSKDYLRREDP